MKINENKQLKNKLSTINNRQSIDWDEIHHRLEETQSAIERGWSPTVEEKKKILKERAQALSQEIKKGSTDEESLEVVEFLLAHEKYGIESLYVREVYPLRDLTHLPGTPPFVLGITGVRGRILSVINIRKFFDIPERGLGERDKIIIVEAGEIELGILADAIIGVSSIPLKDTQPSLPTLTGIRQEYLKCITRDHIVILDIKKFLSDRSIVIHEEAI